MPLATGKKLHMLGWTSLPNDNYIIDRVELIARFDNQPILTNGSPIFKWSPGFTIVDFDKYENEISNDMEQVSH